MIDEFVQKWDERKGTIKNKYKLHHPKNYSEIVKNVIEILHTEDDCDDDPDPENIHEIDDGDYQGTLLYVIARKGYQPSEYWFVKVGYGSCSGCDTLQAITQYEDDPPDDDQVKRYMDLTLHVLQGIKAMQ